MLIGVPSENTKLDKDYLELATTMNHIEKCERPKVLPDTEIPLFYGRIITSSGQDIAGMSGGPIFAFEIVNGHGKYWLVALQSKWLPESKVIIGCPTTFLGLVLEHALKSKYGG